MKAWWLGLAARDRRMLLLGGTLLALLIPYWLIWLPLNDRAARLDETVSRQKADVIWMERAVAEVRALRGAATTTARGPAGQSLLSLIDTTAREGALAGTVRRVQPEGAGTVRIWLENAPFDDVLRWLGGLQSSYGVQVTGLVADRQTQPGLVSARIVLEAGQ